ncbi:MAG: methyltransferase [Bacteroidales bacterium]|nr:methyltransferase [Bacteroidales bacterium]MDD4209321.1 methyltransferase [Bacteroidales bacterium]
MNNVFKHLTSLVLPFTALLFIPWIIENNLAISNVWIFSIGVFIISIGLLCIAITTFTFIKIGKGTLAPWNPTKNIVIKEMYRHVRNPIIIGAIIVLIGESIAFISLNIFIWACVFFLINHLYFILYEEPNLEKKFGDTYINYKIKVNRWIPKLKPYIPTETY